MTYALLLLGAIAIVGWVLLGGGSLPAVSVPHVDTSIVRDSSRSVIGDLNARIRASIRGAIRNQLHEAVDEALPE